MGQRVSLPIPEFSTTFKLGGGVEASVEFDGSRRVRTISYEGDDLKTYNKNLTFLQDPKFIQAYRRGMGSGHHIMREKGSNTDIHIEFRVHTALWAAKQASRLEGDFVECGVNTGIFSLAICDYLDFNSLDKDFYLFDTYKGIPLEQTVQTENFEGIKSHNEKCYSECYEIAKANFEPFPRAHLVRGMIPDTLTDVDIDKVAYLSLDLNISKPELAALEFFWDKLVPGAVIVFDDYAWRGYEEQKRLEDLFVASKEHQILTLPTGQGLLVKQA